MKSIELVEWDFYCDMSVIEQDSETDLNYRDSPSEMSIDDHDLSFRQPFHSLYNDLESKN